MSASTERGSDVAAVRDGGDLIDADHLRVLFPIKSGLIIDRTIGNVHAVDDVSFELREGETIGVVGESGSGKTTLIRALARLAPVTSGTIKFRGQDITSAGRGQLEPIRREMQMVFQDPQASLNPRKRVGQILATPLRLRGVARNGIEAESRRLLERVGLSPEHINRFPHEFSGGQRQRIGIARALAVDPRLILLDEPVSALDVSIQAQVINLLEDLQGEFHLSYIFVAHDLSVVRHVSDRILVMYLGKLMEVSPGETLYSKPIHPYTSALLGAIPIPDPEENRARSRPLLKGEPPSPIRPPSGCRFHTRCPRATDICQRVEPPLADYGSGHLAACHHPQNVSPDEIAAAVRSEASPLSAGQEMPGAAPVSAAPRAVPTGAQTAMTDQEAQFAELVGIGGGKSRFRLPSTGARGAVFVRDGGLSLVKLSGDRVERIAWQVPLSDVRARTQRGSFGAAVVMWVEGGKYTLNWMESPPGKRPLDAYLLGGDVGGLVGALSELSKLPTQKVMSRQFLRVIAEGGGQVDD